MLDEQIVEVLKNYPTLTYNASKRTLNRYLFASIDDWDRYFLNILIADFPNHFPEVWEVGERIPREADRHLNRDGSICFCTKTKEDIYLATRIFNLNDFIQLILIPFLQNNSYFEIHKTYKFGEYSHNFLFATYETYVDVLGIENPIVIEQTIECLINRLKIRPNELCFCGSKKKIKNCSNHQELYKLGRKIPRETLLVDKRNLQDLRKILIEYINSNAPNNDPSLKSPT